MFSGCVQKVLHGCHSELAGWGDPASFLFLGLKNVLLSQSSHGHMNTTSSTHDGFLSIKNSKKTVLPSCHVFNIGIIYKSLNNKDYFSMYYGEDEHGTIIRMSEYSSW